MHDEEFMLPADTLALRAIHVLLEIVHEYRDLDLERAQYEPAPRVKVQQETVAGGETRSDPTFDTVADERRLALRDDVETAREALLVALVKARTARARLESAQRFWEQT